MISTVQNASLIEIELLKLVVSILLGGIIGWQREYTGHEAGIRTFSSICMGSCLFGIISQSLGTTGDPGRIAAQVVSGIGFVGIGVIIREGGSIKGLTTAATLWSMSAIGLAVSFNLYVIACLGTILIFLSLFLTKTKFWHHISRRSGDALSSSPVHEENSTVLQKKTGTEPYTAAMGIILNNDSSHHSCCCKHDGCSSYERK